MTKRFVQQGRNEQKAEAYSLRYDEALSDVKTTLAELCVIFTSGAFRRRTRSTHNAADILRNEARQDFQTHPFLARTARPHGHQDTRQAVSGPMQSQPHRMNLLLAQKLQKL